MATEKIIMVQGHESNGIAPSILTVRMIMQGKEVGSIIGKKGDNIKKYREDSGAKINISDGSCPERIVTITGTVENIQKAFTMICSKFEEQPSLFQDLNNTPTVPKPPVTLRLVVPASQCGSLIGKGGIKIKEIRESTGASIQVASEMLPNSTERAVTVSGTAEAVTACIQVVCNIMLESPPKGATIPYRPKPAVPPVVYAGGQAYVIQNPQVPMPPPAEVWCNCPQEPYGFTLNKLNQMSLGAPMPLMPHATFMPGMLPSHMGLHSNLIREIPGMLPSHMGLHSNLFREIPGMMPLHMGLHSNLLGEIPMSAAPGYAPIPFHQRPLPSGPMVAPNGQQTHEMNIPNDLIGCIIGRGGQKINEIRQISGANIKISNAEEGCPDRKVTITGTPETIGMAQYLINTSMELHKTLVLDPNSTATSPASSVTPTSSPVTPVTSMSSPAGISQAAVSQQASPVTMPMTSMALPGALTSMALPGSMKPLQLIGMNGLNGLSAMHPAYHSLPGFPGMNGSLNGLSLQMFDPMMFSCGINQALPQTAPNFTGKLRVGVAAVKTGSPKFTPY
ncbi:poly(rC)-binding protein 3-like isoform X4 [Dreissena polymorpha]|uniref:poly(rC)-binding protein 3-like isoform X4 n=1 Tax=Dreissena polymorpha TaxID=45954 RepID=UPI0022645BC9|nr:poly(rC)-binding protein 3-like isoform X4 [Dreissena polymorpha]